MDNVSRMRADQSLYAKNLTKLRGILARYGHRKAAEAKKAPPHISSRDEIKIVVADFILAE